MAAGQKPFANPVIGNVQRAVVHDNIVHYRYDVRVGPGQFEVIRLHRVVREQHPYRPVHTVDGVFLLTGAPNSFEMIFMEPLISSVPAWDQGIAIYLAKHNLDVWGMDYGWALVPAETTDFTFMRDWGIERDAAHTRIALSIARSIRTLADPGHGRLHLLGFSWGVYVAYAVAGEETQVPPAFRSVKGLIPVDSALKVDDEAYRLESCASADNTRRLLDAGVYQDNSGALLKQFADWAEASPNDESPFAPPLTNYQFALLAGASGSPPRFWHFVGGTFDQSGVPTGLGFTDPRLWVDALQAVPPYVPLKGLFDVSAVMCGQIDVGFDDHLGKIALPILHVGAAGGDGRYGYYTTTLTASKDITRFTVQSLPDDQAAVDFGHADLFMATSAESLVWRPILNWIVAHR